MATMAKLGTFPAPGPADGPQQKHFTVGEVAELWGVSVDLVRDVFRDEDGVLVFERPGTRTKRGYSMIRIPESVLERVYNKLSKR